MPELISDLDELFHLLNPYLHEGTFAYSSVPIGTDLSAISVVGTFREEEGLTIILEESEAENAGFPILFRAAWITFTVSSAFEAIGMTAAFSTALGNAGISCNVVAGARHDHVFVPIDRGGDAMDVLRHLSRSGPQ
ncbi:ACT domain-containing protein [soil metagenome]